ncbi:MAG TPA: hypothetical protein VFM75_07255, partial [Modicisalibacter sp.]|nr:hypothetical protein [Modicisalibacter sp.]
PESPLKVSGWKPEIDNTPWLVTEVTHSLNEGGFGTQIRCEISGAGSQGQEEQAAENEIDGA